MRMRAKNMHKPAFNEIKNRTNGKKCSFSLQKDA